jgi:hypothetical protein
MTSVHSQADSSRLPGHRRSPSDPKPAGDSAYPASHKLSENCQIASDSRAVPTEVSIHYQKRNESGNRRGIHGARAGSRTLNLGIKRLPTDRLRASQGRSERLSRIRVMTQSSARLLMPHRVSRRSCQPSCQIGVEGRGGLNPPTAATTAAKRRAFVSPDLTDSG